MTKVQNREVTNPLRVRIGITTRNRPEYLQKCLASCLAQTYEPVEIVVWDNSDDPQALELNARLASEFPQVGWGRPEAETTLIQSRVKMMAESGFDLFCSIDDDGWFMGTDELEIVVREFECDPECAGVAFDILSPDRPSAVARHPPRSAMHFVGCGHMLRRSMAEAVGFYFDFPGPYGSEEKDLCIRFLDKDWSVKFLPGVHVWHDKTSAGRDWAAQHRSGTLNDLVFGLLRCPLPDLLYYLPGKALNLALWGLKGTREERWAGLLGLADFCRLAPGLWKQRQPVSQAAFRKFFRGADSSRQRPRGWKGEPH